MNATVLLASVLSGGLLATACVAPGDGDPAAPDGGDGADARGGEDDAAIDPGDPDGGGGGHAGFRLAGTLASTTVAAGGALLPGGAPLAKTITHVMAVNPENARPERRLAAIDGEGGFAVDVDCGRPWVLVFLDASRVGADMIVATFKLGELDSLAPVACSGGAELGTVTANGIHQTATPGIGYYDLLAALALSDAQGQLLGALDDVSLRYANPDVDGNGVLDVEEGHAFLLDFHVRFDARVGGIAATFADITGAFLPLDTTVSFSLGSAYAIWPTSYDSGRYVANGGLVDGASLAFSPDNTPDSYSSLRYGDQNGFGADWNGAGDDMAGGTYVYGFADKALTFTHVVTRSNAELAAANDMLVPFVRLAPVDAGCTSGCAIAAIDWLWRKRVPGGWLTATAEEVALVVNDSGAYLSLSRGPQAAGAQLGFRIPRDQVSGTMAWSAANATSSTLSESEIVAVTTDQLCHMGLSYDDKLGLRIFAGGVRDGGNLCD